MSETLTKQQARAMRAFLWKPGREGFDNETCDVAVWDWDVRPWPTMVNLARKGLIEFAAWHGSEEGWSYRLTERGREYMRTIAAPEQTP